MKTILFLILIPTTLAAQNISGFQTIPAILNQQVDAWNAGNIDGFMESYWKSDSVVFISSQIVRGWTATRDRYKAAYPDKDAMGTLQFDVFQFEIIANDACLVTGKYYLTRKTDNPQGIFTLLFRKKGGKWVIVYDHTS